MTTTLNTLKHCLLLLNIIPQPPAEKLIYKGYRQKYNAKNEIGNNPQPGREKIQINKKQFR